MTGRATKPTPRPTPSKYREGGKVRWQFVFASATRNPDGSRRQIRRKGFETKTAADAELDRVFAEDRANVGGERDLTVGDVLDDFIRAKQLAGRAPGTIAFYEWSAGLAKSRWGGWPATSLTYEQLDKAYVEMQASGKRQHKRGSGTKVTAAAMSARSAEALHKTVKAAFALAVERGHLVRNPASLATKPANTDPKRPYYTPEQVGAFLTYIARLGTTSPLPRGFVDVLADSGGRRGETLALRWADVDLDAGTATITRQLVAHPKTKVLEVRILKRSRSKSTIGLHSATVVALRQRRADQSADRLKMGAGWPDDDDALHGGLIFTFADGRAIHPDTATRIVGRLTVAAGLPRRTPHAFRRSFATAALRARVPVEVVAHRLGNTPRVVQEVYAAVIPADDHDAARRVGDLYRTAGSK